MSDYLILSIFPGIDGLGMGFEEEMPEVCVVRGPDVLWGGDIRAFHPPAGKFWGVIGGPPCQAFSPFANINRKLGRTPKHGNLIPEFERVVYEAQPEWFLMENVERAPVPEVVGYRVVEFFLNPRWLGKEQSRRRRFSFGTRDGRKLSIDGLVIFENPSTEPTVISRTGWCGKNGADQPKSLAAIERDKASRQRSIARLAELQGFTSDFLSDAPFTNAGKRRVIANAVSLPMARAIAKAVRRAMEAQP